MKTVQSHAPLAHDSVTRHPWDYNGVETLLPLSNFTAIITAAQYISDLLVMTILV